MKPPDIRALEAEVARLREINNRLRKDLYKANRQAEEWQSLYVQATRPKGQACPPPTP